MGTPLSHVIRVRYAECDLQGAVFNAHYLTYCDASLTELWRAAFGGYRTMLDRGIDMMLVTAELQFRSPARFDDELTLEVAVAHMGNTSIVTKHGIRRSAEPVADGTLRHVIVDLGSLKKMSIPPWAREGLRPWVVDESSATELEPPRGADRPHSSSGRSPGQMPVR